MKYFKKYSFLIGPIILFLIILKLDFLELINILKEVNCLYFLLAFILLLPFLFIKAYRWNFLKKKQNIHYSLKDSFLIYAVGTCMGMMTPGRIGDFIKVIYLKKDRHSIGKSLTNVTLDRIFDFLFLIVFGYLGMLLFLQVFSKQVLIFSFIILFGFLFLLLLIKLKLHQFLIRKVFYSIVPEKYQKSWKLNFQDFIQGIKAYKTKDYIYGMVITMISWAAYYLVIYFLAQSIGITSIPFLYFITAITISALISILPISVLGLGTRDAALIFLFSFFSISKELSVTLSLLIFFVSLFTAFVGLICWLIKPIKAKK